MMYQYGGKEFQVPRLSGMGMVMEPSDLDASELSLNIVRGDLWDISEFRGGWVPEKREMLTCRKLFSAPGKIRILDMPIKMPGTDVRVPVEAMGMGEFIDKVISHEKAANPAYGDLYCYLTVDQSDSHPGSRQRNAGAHVDGFQGARIGDPLPVDHSYIVSDKADETTLFFFHPFSVDHLDRARDDFFKEFDRQKSYDHCLCHPPYVISLFNAYCVHEARRAQVAGRRTFARLTWTVRQFDRLGNTHNPLFDYRWPMVARDFHG